MSEEQKNTDDSLAEKLEKLIESKKEESSALKKIYASFEKARNERRENQNLK